MLEKLIVNVSIIVPVYNVEKYLEKCMETLVKQNFENYEILLINDGSTDNSGKLCDSYEKMYKNVSVHHQKNAGVSVARNKGIIKSKGTWLMFVDPDDYVSTNIIKTLFSGVDEKVDIISCACKGIYKKNLIPNSFFSKTQDFQDDNKIELYKQLMESQYGQPQKAITAIGVPWGKLYRKSVIEKNELFFSPKLKRMQDNIFNGWFFYYCNKVRYVDKHLYYYRLDNIANYSKKNSDKMLDIYYQVAKERKNFLNKTEMYNSNELKKFYFNEVLLNLFGILNISVLCSNEMSHNWKKKKIIDVVSLPIFNETIKYSNIFDIKKNKHKMEFLLIKLKMFNVFVVVGTFFQKRKTSR